DHTLRQPRARRVAGGDEAARRARPPTRSETVAGRAEPARAFAGGPAGEARHRLAGGPIIRPAPAGADLAVPTRAGPVVRREAAACIAPAPGRQAIGRLGPRAVGAARAIAHAAVAGGAHARLGADGAVVHTGAALVRPTCACDADGERVG